MRRALGLAEQALGWCSPNPAVGAVLVQGDEVVGEGFTQPPGSAHAEVVALDRAGQRARGATLYVTLEPCSHQGRTPPCTDALIAAGVADVRVATLDPSPWVNGSGIQKLRDAGLPVAVGEREQEAARLNEAYFKWVAVRRPFVTLKYAMTADGKSATRTRSSRWITGTESREYVALLRSKVDAVLVGTRYFTRLDSGRVRCDLCPRECTLAEGQRDHPVHQPLRVIVDSAASIPLDARVVADQSTARTLVCTTERASGEKLERLAGCGVETLVVGSRNRKVDIMDLMRALGERGVVSVLAEPGGTLAAGLLEAGAVDKILAFVAPKVAGGVSAPGPVGGEGITSMGEALELIDTAWTLMGRDVLLTGYVRKERPIGSQEAPDVFGNS